MITSDHGEAFNERGHIGHRDLFRETVQVPLIMRLPGGDQRPVQGVRVSTPVALIDVYPTLLEATGVGAAGNGMVDLLEGLRLGAVPEVPIFAETTDHYYQAPGERAMWESVRSGRYVRLRKREGTTTASFLYDGVEDPTERRSLDATPDARRLATELDELLDAHAVEATVARRSVVGDDLAGARAPDEKTLRDLRSLGYVR